MNSEIENTLDRIDAQVDSLGDTYAKGLPNARERGLAFLKSCSWFQHAQQQSIDTLKEMKS